MSRGRKIADREQRVARLGPFSMGEWVFLFGPGIFVTVVAHPPLYLIILTFCVDAAFVLGVLRSFPPGSFKDWVRYQWDYARYGQSVFAPYATDVSLRKGDPFLTRLHKKSELSPGLLLLFLAGAGAIYWILFRL
jgi:hypothetical protein